MKQKHVILSVLLAISLFVPSITFAVDFGPSSAKITNQYYPAAVGDWRHMLGGGNWAGRITYINAVGVEEVSGAQIGVQTFNNVKCLKVNMIMAKDNDEDDFIIVWMAQDTEGNLWILKIYIFPDDDTYLLGTSFQSMFMPAAPGVGDPAGIILEEDADTKCQVVEAGISIDTNFGSYDSCIKSHCLYNSSLESVEYYCLDVGEVRTADESTPNPQSVIDLKEYGTAKETGVAVIPLMD